MDFSALFSGFSNGPLGAVFGFLKAIFGPIFDAISNLFQWIGEKTGLGKLFGSGGGGGQQQSTQPSTEQILAGGLYQPQPGTYYQQQYQQSYQPPLPETYSQSPAVVQGGSGRGNIFVRLGRGTGHVFGAMGRGIAHGAEATYHAIARLGGTPLDAAQMQVESSGINGTISNKGAMGLMQVELVTAQDMARREGIGGIDAVRLRTDAAYNLHFGHEYQQEMLKKYQGYQDGFRMAIAAYNAGPGAVNNAVKKARAEGGNWLSYMPVETQNYVPRVMTALDAINRQQSNAPQVQMASVNGHGKPGITPVLKKQGEYNIS